ncbi:MAG: YdcF family protein [Kofleriaceae bacterium]
MIGALARLLERPLVLDAPLQPLDAIVVLGAPLDPRGKLTAVLDERVAAAVALWRAGGAPLVVATGGATGGPRAEAAAIAEALEARGVPGVLIEDRSRSTAENARHTAALLAERGARRVWVVTQPFHGRRAAHLFRGAGLEPHVWHIADSLEYRDRPRALRWLVREYAAWAALVVRRR